MLTDYAAPEKPAEFAARVIITWPAPSKIGAVSGWAVSITDAETGEPLDGVMHLTLVFASAADVVWARALMLVNRDGKPVTSASEAVLNPDGQTAAEGIFDLEIAEMRIAE